MILPISREDVGRRPGVPVRRGSVADSRLRLQSIVLNNVRLTQRRRSSLTNLSTLSSTTLDVDSTRTPDDLSDYVTHDLNPQIEAVVNMVRNDLKSSLRITLAALIVLQIHNRDVTQKLVGSNITDTTDFVWVSQLRVTVAVDSSWIQDYINVPSGADYHMGSVLKVQILDYSEPYLYEYLGNTDRLVITPLTDRCYRTMMSACHLLYGGAPEGPAGTGKTETVKDMSKACGTQCVVFNCQDGLTTGAMGKMFKGLATSGAWSCFDEFNRIQLEVLSVIGNVHICYRTLTLTLTP
jgi:dynein heavy chain